MGVINRFIKNRAVHLIDYYQKKISSPFNSQKNSHCCFEPSCSQYTKEAIIEQGVIKGSMQGFFRLLRCAPDVRLHDTISFYNLLSTANDKEINESLKIYDSNTAGKLKILRDEAIKQPVKSIDDHISETAAGILSNLEISSVDPVKASNSTHLFTVRYIDSHAYSSCNKSVDHINALQDTPQATSTVGRFIKQAIHTASQATGVTAIAVIGGGIGLAAGIVIGIIIGGISSLDKVDQVSNAVASHFSPASTAGLDIIELSCGGPAYKLHHAMSDHKIPHWLASTIACLPGIISGAGLGIWYGTKVGVKEGRNMWNAFNNT